VSSFRSRQRFDLSDRQHQPSLFPPLNATSWDDRLNLDGTVSYSGRDEGDGFRSYTQFFHNGIVEGVQTEIVAETEDRGKLLLAGHYEYGLTYRPASMTRYMKGLRELGVEPPIWCFISLVGVKGARIPTSGYFSDERRDIDRDVLLLPETIIDDLDRDALDVLRPSFDLVWNASGYSGTSNFDAEGKWIGKD
ncbi:MAG: hypothetical protein AAF664_25610, partial [Planctomycetota bacterium]